MFTNLLMGAVLVLAGVIMAPQAVHAAPSMACPGFTPEFAHEKWKGAEEGWSQLRPCVLEYRWPESVVIQHIPRNILAWEPAGGGHTWLYTERLESTYFVLERVPSPGTGFVKHPPVVQESSLRGYKRQFGGRLRDWSVGDCCHYPPVFYSGSRLIFVVPLEVIVEVTLESGSIKRYLPGKLFKGRSFRLYDYNES